MTYDLEFVRKCPDRCCAETTRDHQVQPCDKIAVAAAFQDEHAYPVCKYHAFLSSELVPLDVLLGVWG